MRECRNEVPGDPAILTVVPLAFYTPFRYAHLHVVLFADNLPQGPQEIETEHGVTVGGLFPRFREPGHLDIYQPARRTRKLSSPREDLVRVE